MEENNKRCTEDIRPASESKCSETFEECVNAQNTFYPFLLLLLQRQKRKGVPRLYFHAEIHTKLYRLVYILAKKSAYQIKTHQNLP